MFINLGIVLLCTALWMVPFIIMAKPDKNILGRMLVGMVACGFAVYNLVVVLNTVRDAQLAANVHNAILSSIIGGGVTGIMEEVLKFSIAFMCVKKMKNARYIDLVLIFGAVGAAFSMREAMAYGALGVGDALMKSLIATHIIWLFVEGIGYAEQKLCNKKIMVRYLLICILIHGITDIAAGFMNIQGVESLGIGIAFVVFVINILLTVFIIRKMLQNRPAKMPA